MAFFTIRKEHLDALNKVAEEEFVSQVGLHLRRNHHKIVGEIPEDKFRQMVEAGIARARKNGLTMNTSITAFVALMFEVAPNFDQYPLVNTVLSGSQRNPDDQIFELSKTMTSQDWEKAGQLYDPSAWHPNEEAVAI